jgi:hypothetical protein
MRVRIAVLTFSDLFHLISGVSYLKSIVSRLMDDETELWLVIITISNLFVFLSFFPAPKDRSESGWSAVIFHSIAR